MITSGIAGRPTGSVRINPRAPFADRLVGAYLFGHRGYALDIVGRNSTPLGTAVQTPAPFGLGVQTLTGAGFVTPNPPPYVASFACGGYLPEANVTGLVIGAGLDQWSMAGFNWAAFVNAGTWRFGCGVQGSVGSGTPAPVGRFDVGMARDPTTALPNAWCYVDGVQVVTSDTPNGTSAIYPIRSRITVQTPSKAILDYLLLFAIKLPAWAFAEIRRNPYQYFQTTSRSLWLVPASAPATSVSIDSPVGIGSSLALTLASPNTDVAIASAVGIGLAASITLASPATSVSINSQVGIGAAASVTLASPATSVSIASSVGIGAALSATLTSPATSLAIASQVGIGAAIGVTLTSPVTSLAIASQVGVGAALAVNLTSPTTTFAIDSAVGIGASLSATLTSPTTSVSVNSAVGIGAAMSVALASSNVALAIASPVGIGLTATFAFSSPGTASWEFARARIRAFRNPPA